MEKAKMQTSKISAIKTQSEAQDAEALRLAEYERVGLGAVGFAGVRGDADIYPVKRLTRPIDADTLNRL